MPLIISKAAPKEGEEIRTWAKTPMTYCVSNGHETEDMNCQYIIPTAKKLKADMEELTVPQMVEKYWVDAKDYKIDESGELEKSLSDETKQLVISSVSMRNSVWDKFLELVKGGKLKNL